MIGEDGVERPTEWEVLLRLERFERLSKDAGDLVNGLPPQYQLVKDLDLTYIKECDSIVEVESRIAKRLKLPSRVVNEMLRKIKNVLNLAEDFY